MASQASPTTNRKAAWEQTTTTNTWATSLLANTQSTETPTSSRVLPQAAHLKDTSSQSILENGLIIDDEEDFAPLPSAETTEAHFDALVASDAAAEAAYNDLFAHITAHSNGEKFLAKIDKPLFKKMFIEFFSKNPGFKLDEKIKIEQPGKVDSSKNYVSNKLTVGNFKYKVHRDPNDSVFEGTYDPKNRLTEGKITYADGRTEEGDFVLNADGTHYLAKGKKTYANGNTLEGTFALNEDGTLYLAEGKITDTNGTIQAGIFDSTTGLLTEGKITFASGITHEGTFALNEDGTHYFAKGKITLANGNTLEGTFALNEDGKHYLAKGKKTLAHGQIQAGIFDSTTGLLTQGKITLADGEIQAGIFSETGRLLNGKYKPIDVSAVIAEAQQAVETANTIVQTLRGKYHY